MFHFSQIILYSLYSLFLSRQKEIRRSSKESRRRFAGGNPSIWSRKLLAAEVPIWKYRSVSGLQRGRRFSVIAETPIFGQGEKLLGSLGVTSSKTWKPKKTRPITGRFVKRDDPTYRNGSHLEQREKLGLTSAPQGRSNTRAQAPEPTNALQKVEVEKLKQDDALSDLSNILGELKKMAIDMGSEIDRQKPGLDALTYDVEEINNRVKGANQGARRLLGK